MAHVGKIKVPVEIICSCDRERWQAMNVLLSEQLEEARGNRGQPGSFWVGWRAAARAIEEGWAEKPETDT